MRQHGQISSWQRSLSHLPVFTIFFRSVLLKIETNMNQTSDDLISPLLSALQATSCRSRRQRAYLGYSETEKRMLHNLRLISACERMQLAHNLEGGCMQLFFYKLTATATLTCQLSLGTVGWGAVGTQDSPAVISVHLPLGIPKLTQFVSQLRLDVMQSLLNALLALVLPVLVCEETLADSWIHKLQTDMACLLIAMLK